MTELINDKGELVPHYFGENGVPDFYANSAEDVKRIREIVALVDRKTLSDLSYVCQIIGEEIKKKKPCRPPGFTVVQLEKYLVGGLQSGYTVNLSGLRYKLHTKHKKVWYDLQSTEVFSCKIF